MADYILVVRAETNGKELTAARDVTMKRFASGIWPLNASTRHQRDFVEGDRLLIYVAGAKDPDRHHVIARGQVRRSVIKSDRQPENRPPWMKGISEVLYDLPVSDLEWYSSPILVPAVAKSLAFIRDAGQWGTYLQGGVKRISADDFSVFSSRMDSK
jgi:hypothetical protein